MCRRWKDVHQAEAFPKEFREDVIRVFKDSEVLVIGAMVLGPEFIPIAALCSSSLLAPCSSGSASPSPSPPSPRSQLEPSAGS